MISTLKFSPKIFFLTILVGVVFELFIGSAYSVFTSSASNNSNTFTTGFWVTPTPTPSPTATPSPTPTLTLSIQVVLNEFMPKPSDNQDWVELYNLSLSTVDISEWKLADEAGVFETFSQGTSLAPNSYLVVSQFQRLNNDGDSIFLKDASEATIDSRSYTDGEVSTDLSIGRAIDGGSQWKICTISTKGTTNTGYC